MFGFLTPRVINEGKEMLKAAHKMLCYKRDLLKPEAIASLETKMAELKTALKKRDKEAIPPLCQAIDEEFAGYFPRAHDAAIRENAEVVAVALIITLGIRSFLLQPFTIPTGSMQPTLNGIIAYRTETPAPSLPVRLAHAALYGRSYVDLTSKEEDQIISTRPVKRFIFLNYTEIQCVKQRFLAHAPQDKLRELGVQEGRVIHTGETFARGYINTGDHVFVDKVSYNFTAPKLGDVFVFNTLGIRTGSYHPGEVEGVSQFYIKRLAGLPGDQLRIDPPNLYINGEIPDVPSMLRVMEAKDGYRGYSNRPDGGRPFPHLGSPTATFNVPPDAFFALGDNSYQSSDSRNWGIVPEKNVTGRGFFVYWPFTSHWGFIR